MFMEQNQSPMVSGQPVSKIAVGWWKSAVPMAARGCFAKACDRRLLGACPLPERDVLRRAATCWVAASPEALKSERRVVRKLQAKATLRILWFSLSFLWCVTSWQICSIHHLQWLIIGCCLVIWLIWGFQSVSIAYYVVPSTGTQVLHFLWWCNLARLVGLISRLKNTVGWFVVKEKYCSGWKKQAEKDGL
jgi:hypothetical protein